MLPFVPPNTYESKKYMDIQLENIKGITEQKCFRRKFREDYCEA